MKFDIRYYIWNVFEISRAQKVSNIFEAAEMFLLNIELGTARYKGATKVDYFELMKRNAQIPQHKRVDQMDLLRKCLDRCGSDVFKAWKEQDREKLNQICINDVIHYKSATDKR